MRVAVAFAGAVGRVAEEVGGDERRDHFGRDVAVRRIGGEFVPGDLLGDETVEGLVIVERRHHVIPIAVGQRALGVGAEITVGIGVARHVEPMPAPAFPIVRRSQQALDELFVSIRRVVGHELSDLRRRGRQAKEVELQAPDQRGAAGFR